MPGILTISLDFEMEWGLHDRTDLESYRPNLVGERAVVPRLLKLFSTYGVHATWATVGFLFFSKKNDLLASLPEHLPTYADPKFSPYRLLSGLGEDEALDPTHFAFSLLQQIAETPGQEIGSHTFSHYYCLEEGQTAEAFRDDVRMALTVAKDRGWELKSFVFPRNQCSEAHLAVCRESGFQTYRGNELSWMYRAANEHGERPWRRAARLLDAYLPISGHNTYSLKEVAGTSKPFNLRSSRFLRPFIPALRWFESIRIWRICRDIRYAAEHNQVYHLWWHPHNFGIHSEENFRFLERILQTFESLRASGKMVSLTMGEIGEQL